MKILKRITAITGILAALYLAGCMILPYTRYSYRMWTDVSGKLLLTLVFPLLLLLVAGIWLWKRKRLHLAVKILLSVAVAAAYVFWGFWILVYLIFTIQEEKQLTKHLLVVNESEFLGAARYEYYRPAAFLFREPGELTEEIKEEYLEEKYGVYVKKFAGLDVRVSANGMILEDNFTECVTAYLAELGLKDHGIQREYYVAENYAGMPGWLYLELEGENDIEDFAVTAGGLIQYILAWTDFYETNRGMICFYCGEGEEQVTGSLPFGKLSQWDQLEPEYYRDTELLAERITEEYEDGIRFRKRMEADQERYEERKPETVEKDGIASEEEQCREGESFSVEDAAELIYKDVLADQGYTCTPCYNAKGNFYLDLGERPAGETEDYSSTGYYRFTLVYDRTSKNGNCELFVLYKEHYEEDADGNRIQDGTAIQEIYAVEIASGKVIASGRRAWSDVGTQEYRDATGE